MFYPPIVISVLLVLVTGCASLLPTSHDTSLKEEKPPNAGFLLMFTETQSNQEARPLRMIITDNFVRFDDGRKGQGFELFNRQTQTITHVNADNQIISSTLIAKVNLKPANPLHWTIVSQASQVVMRAEATSDTAAMHHRFSLNDEPCFNVVTINNHLLGAVAAIREYNQAVAQLRKASYQKDVSQQCEEAIMMYSPDIRLQQGFPLREWNSFGYRRFLVDYQKDVVFPITLFTLPNS